MRLRVNGEEKEGVTTTTVGALLRELGIEAERVVVEVNLMIVRRSEFDLFPLADGDTIEIINFVGGG